MGSATIGVVIRTLNESALLGTCIDTLRAQRRDAALDILVVDSGSTDSTLEIARAHGARIVEIAPQDFDYSRALNLGIEEVAGELVVILSAHAIPLGDDWLAAMTAPFADPAVAGVACRQVPWPDAPFAEAHRLAQTFGTQRRAYGADAADDVLFSNAASCIRRSDWLAQPFTLPAAEDAEWARRLARAGRAIVYEARAEVRHSHNETPRARARRVIDIMRGGALSSGRRTRRRTLREAAHIVYRDGRLIVALDEPVRRKLRHLSDVLQTAGFYVLDFSRAGSTAQLRREHAAAQKPS